MRHTFLLALIGAAIWTQSLVGFAQDAVCVNTEALEQAGINVGVDYDIVKGLLEQRGWQLKPVCVNPSECIEATEICGVGTDAHCQGHFVQNGRVVTVDYFRDTARLYSLTCDFLPASEE